MFRRNACGIFSRIKHIIDRPSRQATESRLPGRGRDRSDFPGKIVPHPPLFLPSRSFAEKVSGERLVELPSRSLHCCPGPSGRSQCFPVPDSSPATSVAVEHKPLFSRRIRGKSRIFTERSRSRRGPRKMDGQRLPALAEGMLRKRQYCTKP